MLKKYNYFRVRTNYFADLFLGCKTPLRWYRSKKIKFSILLANFRFMF